MPKEQGEPTSPAAAQEAEKSKDEASTKEGAEQQGDRKTTTEVRKALEVPDSVHVSIDAKNLVEYVGPQIYQRERIYTRRTPPGVSTGLGYLGNGSGSVMPIEATVMPGSGIQLTGKLGEVIKESAQIALSFIKTHAHTLGLTKTAMDDLLEKKAVHVHMPEGSIGKEGPSAGTALLSAFISLFTKQGLPSDLAMTGEITLAGQGEFSFGILYGYRNADLVYSAAGGWSEREASSRAPKRDQEGPCASRRSCGHRVQCSSFHQGPHRDCLRRRRPPGYQGGLCRFRHRKEGRRAAYRIAIRCLNSICNWVFWTSISESFWT